jgi:hypothetical protein
VAKPDRISGLSFRLVPRAQASGSSRTVWDKAAEEFFRTKGEKPGRAKESSSAGRDKPYDRATSHKTTHYRDARSGRDDVDTGTRKNVANRSSDNGPQYREAVSFTGREWVTRMARIAGVAKAVGVRLHQSDGQVSLRGAVMAPHALVLAKGRTDTGTIEEGVTAARDACLGGSRMRMVVMMRSEVRPFGSELQAAAEAVDSLNVSVAAGILLHDLLSRSIQQRTPTPISAE